MKEVVRRPENVRGVVPVVGHDIITRQSKAALLAEVKRGSLAGEFGGVSPLVWSGTAGVWAVKVERLKPAPVPPPAWHRTAKILGLVVGGILLVCSGLALAVGYAIEKASAAAGDAAKALPPLDGVLGILVIVGVLVLLAGGGKACTTVIKHYH